MDSLLGLAQNYAENFVLYTLILLLSVTFVVFVHEMGHLLAARLFGVRVLKLSLGFGRELFGYTAAGSGTRWSWSMYPLGGYVALFGYDSAPDPTLWDHEKQERRAFTDAERRQAFCFKPLWQRAVIVASGPLANFVLAVVILSALYMTQGQGSTKAIVYAVGMDSAAGDAGLQPLDEIVALDGRKIARFEDVWEKSFTPNQHMVWTIRRGETVLDVALVSRPVVYRDEKGIYREHGRTGATNFPAVKIDHVMKIDGVDVRGKPDLARQELQKRMDSVFPAVLEIAANIEDEFLINPLARMNDGLFDPASEEHDFLVLSHNKDEFYVRHDPARAVWYAGAQVYKFVDEAIRFLGVAFLPQNNDTQKVGGLITMGQAAGEAADKGLYTFMILLAILSVQIGMVNLMPIPVLDGGYLLFFLYEAVAGRPLPARVQDYALIGGLILLLGIMIFANVSDFLRMFL